MFLYFLQKQFLSALEANRDEQWRSMKQMVLIHIVQDADPKNLVLT